MADDKNERQEVDFLIKELASRKIAASKPAAPPPVMPTVKKASIPPPVPEIAAPGPRSTTRVAAPVTSSRTFVSEIRLKPAMKMKALSLDFGAISMPSFSIPSFSLRSIPMPAFTEVTAVRAWVGLGAALAIAMPFWPYAKAYSWGLFLYLFAVALVIFSGIWSARLTWLTRLAIAHTLAVTILVWGVTLAAAETLPRIGYVKAETTWFHP